LNGHFACTPRDGGAGFGVLDTPASPNRVSLRGCFDWITRYPKASPFARGGTPAATGEYSNASTLDGKCFPWPSLMIAEWRRRFRCPSLSDFH